MAKPRYNSRHQAARKALLAVTPPAAPCARCGHPLWHTAAGVVVHLDHGEDGGYLGFSHGTPCQACGKRCNEAAAGRKAATMAGRTLRERDCEVCGKPYKASHKRQRTCGRAPCRRAIRRMPQPAAMVPVEPPSMKTGGRPW